MLCLTGITAVQAQDAASVLTSRCASCHERTANGGLSRVEDMRKTPEGWDMTIARMTVVHGVQLSADERATLVKHLADTQGLAPAETKDYRYVLERRPNMVEAPVEGDLAAMCGRCHTLARSALQRRDTAEWTKLSHFHLGQYPTTEYQALGRDRNWWEIASTVVPEQLGKLFPLDTPSWTDWRTQKAADLSGSWRVVGRRPGRGSYQGAADIRGTGSGRYAITLDLTFGDGSTVSGSGNAIVYTGYEWRARLDLGGEAVLQVFQVSADGNELSGRWFLEDQDSVGGDLRAVRAAQAGQILAAQPAYIQSGTTARVAIHGVGLAGPVVLGAGVRVERVLAETPESVVVEATAEAGAQIGSREIKVGRAAADGLFTVYRQIDSLKVEPAEAIARVGGAGGPLPPVPAQFEAVAYANGPDGLAGSVDDIRIGVVPARWSVDNFNEVAEDMEDTKFAGGIDAAGLFMPAAAGPNPARPFGTNNVGDLAIKALVSDKGRQVEGTGHLVVTVQRWNDPPIR